MAGTNPNSNKITKALVNISVHNPFYLWLITALVIQHTLNHLHQLLVLRESESLLPQPRPFIADDEDVEMIIFVVNKLTNLLQREVDVLLVAGEEIPTRPGIQFFRIRL